MNSQIKSPSKTKTAISVAASAAATAMLLGSIARSLLPYELRRNLATKFYNHCASRFDDYRAKITNEITVTIYEFDGLIKNQLFASAEIYLATIISPSVKRFNALVFLKETKIHISPGESEEVVDEFRGFQLTWRFVKKQNRPGQIPGQAGPRATRCLELIFHNKHRNQVLDEYLPYILGRAKDLKDQEKTLKLHMLRSDAPRIWQAVNLDHSSTFETLAMDFATKKMIMEDLDRFLKRKDLYKKVGKAWKRGYLLYGPPGTGKSSLIAAMANYLNFDVYDLELTDIKCNSELRKLLIRTANRSILVVEDIDVSIDLSDRKTTEPNRTTSSCNEEPKVTLSGLLNFTDGLWSSCGDERIIVFTTNNIEKLDPALLRPGRMDVHIHMSYCTPAGFRILASNYLGIEDHPLALKAEAMMEEVNVTPAQVAEQLLKHDDPDHTLQGLMEFLENKKLSERERVDREEILLEGEAVKTELAADDDKEVKKVKGKGDGIEELIKKNKAEVREQVVKIYEAVNALKKLMGIVGGEKGLEYIKYSDSVVESSGSVIKPKSRGNHV